MTNIPCKCKHFKSSHKYWPSLLSDVCCDALDIRTYKICGCTNYVGDNLLYIEELAKERNLI